MLVVGGDRQTRKCICCSRCRKGGKNGVHRTTEATGTRRKMDPIPPPFNRRDPEATAQMIFCGGDRHTATITQQKPQSEVDPNAFRTPSFCFALDISLKLRIQVVVWNMGAHQPGGPHIRTTTTCPFRSSPPGMSRLKVWNAFKECMGPTHQCR